MAIHAMNTLMRDAGSFTWGCQSRSLTGEYLGCCCNSIRIHIGFIASDAIFGLWQDDCDQMIRTRNSAIADDQAKFCR